jgi:hypothetical protein
MGATVQSRCCKDENSSFIEMVRTAPDVSHSASESRCGSWNRTIDLLRVRPAGQYDHNQQSLFARCRRACIVLRFLAGFANFVRGGELPGLFFHAASSSLQR